MLKKWFQIVLILSLILFLSSRVESATDTTPPIIISSSPQDTVSTNQIVLKIVTDEPAQCRYSLADKSFFDMEFLLGNNYYNINHTSSTLSLDNGVKTFYVRCNDISGNKNINSYILSFIINKEIPAPDVTPPTITRASPNGIIYQKSIALNITTNEPAMCKFSTIDKPYSHMISFVGDTSYNTEHSQLLSLMEGKYNYYIKCQDTSGNVPSQSYILTFEKVTSTQYQQDSTPPTIISASPQEVISDKNTTLKIQTSEPAQCRYSKNLKNYEDMEYIFSQTYSTNHTSERTLQNGNYKFYINCIDSSGNRLALPYSIIFTVNESSQNQEIDSTPPIITDMIPIGIIEKNNITMKIKTNELTLCKYSIIDKQFNEMEHFFGDNYYNIEHSQPLNNLKNGNYTFYIRCIDSVSNANIQASLLQFEVIENIEKPNSVCNGCLLNNSCVSIGYRTNGRFCAISNLTLYKQTDAPCENNFECSSNLCVSNKCISSNLFDKIIAWFKRLFDGN